MECQLTFKRLTVCESRYMYANSPRLSRSLADTWSISYSLDRSPNLPDKINFWAFLCFSMEFSPNLTRSMVSGVFLCNILSMTKIILSLQLQLKSIHVDMEGGGRGGVGCWKGGVSRSWHLCEGIYVTNVQIDPVNGFLWNWGNLRLGLRCSYSLMMKFKVFSWRLCFVKYYNYIPWERDHLK